MNEPRRLNSEDGDDFERTLLRSARSDGPSPAGKKRTLLALTLGAALAGGTSSGAAVAAPSVAATVVQWMAVGALVGTGTLVSVSALTPPETPPAPSAAQPHRAPQASRTSTVSPKTLPGPLEDAPPADRAPPAPESSAPAAGLEQGAPSPVPGREPSLGSSPRGLARAAMTEAPPAPGRAPAPESASAPAPTPPTADPAATAVPPVAAVATATALVEDPLVGELLALDSARAALGQGDLGGARAALGRYAERYPRGKLSTEAKILGIELLLRQGNRAAAHQEASSFLQAFPQSPHAPRLRALLGISSP